MTGRNIARYMRLDRLIPEFKDAVDKGTLAMVDAVDLSYLNHVSEYQTYVVYT